MKLVVLFIYILSLYGCALPASSPIPEDFISPQELALDKLHRTGLTEASKGRYVDAEFAFRKVLHQLPENDAVKLNLAVSLERQGVFREAEQLFLSLLAKNVKNLRARSGLARVYTSLGDEDAAIREYEFIYGIVEDSLESLPLNVKQNVQKSGLQSGKKKSLKAKQGSNKPSTRGVDKIDAKKIDGEVESLAKEEVFNPAIGKYREIGVSALRSLSTIYNRIGEVSTAVCHAKKATEFFPTNLFAKSHYSKLLIGNGNLKDAEKLLIDEEAPLGKLSSKNIPLFHQIALLKYEQGKKEEAKDVCSGVLISGKLPSQIEQDCYWIVALAGDYRIVDLLQEDVPDEIAVSGIQLSYKDFSLESVSDYSTFQLSQDIESVQQSVFEGIEGNSAKGEVDTTLAPEKLPSLFALPM